MPKTTRDRMKGSIATAYLDCERALIQLAEVEMAFADVHGELAEGLRIAATLIMKAQELMCAFYREAWGNLPTDWGKTRDRK